VTSRHAFAALVGGALVLWPLFLGCGAAPQVGAYGVVGAACIAQERAIVDRAGTTFEQDTADLALVRTVCDAILTRIENEVP